MIFHPKNLVSIFLFASVISPSPFHSCVTAKQSTATITKISYSSAGGRAGNSEKLEISSDSLFYVQARGGVEKTIKEKTVKEFWKGLIGKISFKDFDKITSDPGHALYDGIDVTITIETKNEKHSLVNGSEDAINYERISPFTDMLENKLEELRTKITW